MRLLSSIFSEVADLNFPRGRRRLSPKQNLALIPFGPSPRLLITHPHHPSPTPILFLSLTSSPLSSPSLSSLSCLSLPHPLSHPLSLTLSLSPSLSHPLYLILSISPSLSLPFPPHLTLSISPIPSPSFYLTYPFFFFRYLLIGWQDKATQVPV